MRYFENFPLTQYTFDPDRREFFNVKDIFTRVNMLNSIITNSLVYYDYLMKDTDNLEIIAHKYYGDANKYWIIAFTNTILNPLFEIPLKPQQMEDYLISKYGSPETAEGILDHYEKKMTNSMTSIATGESTTSTTISYYPNTVHSIEGSISLPSNGSSIDISPVDDTAYFYGTPYTITPDGSGGALSSPIYLSVGYVYILTTTGHAFTVMNNDGANYWYEDTSKVWTYTGSQWTSPNLISTAKTQTTISAISAYDTEIEANEAKRKVKLIKKDFAPQIEAELKKLLKATTGF